MSLRGLDFWALTESGWTLRGTVVSDGGGGGTTVFVSGGTVACRIDPLARAGDERVVGGRLDDRSTHKVTSVPTVDVDASDRFQIQGRGVYEVTAVRDRTDEPTKVFEVVAT